MTAFPDAAEGAAAGSYLDDEVQFISETPPPPPAPKPPVPAPGLPPPSQTPAQPKGKRAQRHDPPQYHLTVTMWTDEDDDAAAAEILAATRESDAYSGLPVARLNVESSPNSRAKARRPPCYQDAAHRAVCADHASVY